MLRSKSRSGSFDFRLKSHSSILSRTISSKLCRGDALLSQIDKGALATVERKPPKVVDLSENLIFREVKMQMERQIDESEDEKRRMKDQLAMAEEERDRAFRELQKMKQVVHEKNMKQGKALSPRKAEEVFSELKSVQESLSNSKQESEMKDKNIETLKVELQRAKQFELQLVEKNALLNSLKEALSNANVSESRAMNLLSESKRRIQELEAEMGRQKQSESKMINSLAIQTKQLEQTKIELEESKLEIASFHEKLGKLENSSRLSSSSSRNVDGFHGNENEDPMKGTFESLNSVLQLAKEKLDCAQEGEKQAILKAKSLAGEMESLRNELKLATDAEEKSRKAMDDLALALTEVATEANQAKEKLSSTQLELEHVKEEAEQIKAMVRSTEERYQKLLDEANKETELYRNSADRLNSEADESNLAWNAKEIGFITCIKKTEEEKAIAHHENIRLTESLMAAENMTRSAREENYKLRDILKQALNEANVAKEAASIARNENSQLKDSLAEKEEALDFLTRENERLRINEAAAHESAKGFKRLLSAASQELKMDDGGLSKSPSSVVEHEEPDRTKAGFSFDLNELKFLDEPEAQEEADVDEDPQKAEALKGSIFDPSVNSPNSEPRTPKPPSHHQRGSSFVFTDDEGTATPKAEEFEHPDVNHADDPENDRNSHRRRKALLRRFGDLIMKKSFHRREPSVG